MNNSSENQKQIAVDNNTGRVIMIQNFPIYPQRNEVNLRSTEEVAKRALTLHLLLGIIYYEDPKELVEWTIQEGLWDALSPHEKEIFQVPISDLSPEEKQWHQQSLQNHLITWRIEGLVALLWCLDLVKELEVPTHRCDGISIGQFLPMPGESLQTFIQKATLRPVEELVHMLEQHFQIYHQQIEAIQNQQEAPFDMLVTYERIHALSWVCGLNDEWDD